MYGVLRGMKSLAWWLVGIGWLLVILAIIYSLEM